MASSSRRSVAACVLLIGILFSASAEAQEAPGYSIQLPETLDMVAGSEASLSLSLVPGNGRHIDPNGPLRLRARVDGEAAILRGKSVLHRRDSKDPRSPAPRFELSLRAQRPGNAELAIELRFWLCRGDICKPVVARRTLTVVVSEAPAPEPAPEPAPGPAPSL